jgi:hypothetical protein
LIGRIALVIAAALVAVWMLWRFLPALAWAAVLAIATWPLRRPNHDAVEHRRLDIVAAPTRQQIRNVSESRQPSWEQRRNASTPGGSAMRLMQSDRQY